MKPKQNELNFKTKPNLNTTDKDGLPSSSREGNSEIVYIQADKPLTFTFKNAVVMEDFLDKEPTSGTKRKVEKRIETQEKNEKAADKNSIHLFLDEDDKPEQKKKKDLNKESEVIEGSLRGDKMAESKGRKLYQKEDEKKETQKNKIVYKTYTNSIILANNELKALDNITNVLAEIVPDVSFTTRQNKLDFIQWIDVSRNHLTQISEHLANLPFLKIFYCHGNYIQEIEKVLPLAKCPSLTSLTLYGNPIEHIRGYRQFVIEMIPLLDKLDYALVSEKELDIIHFKGSRWGEVRKNGKVLRYPKLSDEMLKTFKIPDSSDKDKRDEI